MNYESVNIHEAKTNLSKLLAAVEAGERVIISRAGKPIAQVTAYRKPQKKNKVSRVPGALKGYFQYGDDVMDPLPEDMWHVYNENPMDPLTWK